MYDDIDFSRLFDESEDGSKYNLGSFDESRIKAAEDYTGYKLPKSFIEFLKIRNGGRLSEEYSECWLTAICGLGENEDTPNSFQDLYNVCINDLECPKIGIPFGETQTAGHEHYFLDYTVVDEDGEPRIVQVDNECGNEISFVANNFREFIEKVYRHEDVEGYPLYAEEAGQQKQSQKLDDINTNVSLCRGGIFCALIGLIVCLLLGKYIPAAICAVIVVLLFVPERRYSKEYDRVKNGSDTGETD